MNDTDKSKLRDYRQYVSWQVVALLRSLKVVNDLTPMQMKLVEAKSDLMAETIKSDVSQQCNQVRDSYTVRLETAVINNMEAMKDSRGHSRQVISISNLQKAIAQAKETETKQ